MKNKTIITLTEEQDEEAAQGLKELLESPEILKRVKSKYREMIAEMFNCDALNVDIEFETDNGDAK